MYSSDNKQQIAQHSSNNDPFFSFPHPVNEVAARLVALMVLMMTLSIIISNAHWLTFLLTYGFLARVLTGPKLSPMGLLATRVIVPMLGNKNKNVAGPPKRFAQFVGLIFSSMAMTAYLIGFPNYCEYILYVLVVFTILESIFGFCAGCLVFGYLIRLGMIPEETCKRCADIWV